MIPQEKRTKRSLDATKRVKPPQYSDYLTIQELCQQLGKDPSWIRRLERKGRLPEPARVQRGKASFRLYSPQMVEEIKAIFKTHKIGRPKKEG